MGIKLPPHILRIREILAKAHELGGLEDYVVRLTVSRGSGSFSVNPQECQGPELYLITMRLKRPSAETYERGVSLATAPFPSSTVFAGIKTCDYVGNVLAKKAALEAGADYPVGFDREGFLTEGATENVAVVTTDRELVVPPFEKILKGVTLLRVLDLARTLTADGTLKAVVNRDVPRSDLPDKAAEVFLTSTSFDVLGVTRWDGRPVGDGRVGPVTRALTRLIDKEIGEEGPHSVPVL